MENKTIEALEKLIQIKDETIKELEKQIQLLKSQPILPIQPTQPIQQPYYPGQQQTFPWSPLSPPWVVTSISTSGGTATSTPSFTAAVTGSPLPPGSQQMGHGEATANSFYTGVVASNTKNFSDISVTNADGTFNPIDHPEKFGNIFSIK
jgi:hypothetical protein